MSTGRRGLRVAPFGGEHVEPAARLLADRHQRDRLRAPSLPAAFETVGATLPMVQQAFLSAETSGVVAYLGEAFAGFLLGRRTVIPAESTIAPYYRPSSILVRYDAHAALSGSTWDIYRELFAAAADRWVSDGLTAHYIQLPAGDDAAIDAWASVGFGRDMGWGLRDTGPIEPAQMIPGLTIRRTTVDDLDVTFQLDTALARYESRSPVFMPYPTAVAEREWRADLSASLADDQLSFWLAELDSRPVGLLNVNPPPAHISPLLTPDTMVNISAASVVPDVRGIGIGGALVRHALDAARSEGHAWCRMSWMTANLYSSRFWSRHGFEPVAWRMSRVIDERAVAW
ncbi:MAG TPA: GNAT family N-acetyltransferase [Thermomicrobiales bacterium]|nr:GNAT family N-acetyltransferase [Thermomicrobiales bacterium]